MKKDKKIKITINNKKINCLEGETVLVAALRNGIEIPALCHHSDLKIKANCRLCLVKKKEEKALYTACSLKVEPGMNIVTNSAEITRARKINLELIFAQHCEECHDCVWNFNCQLLKLAKKYKVNITRFFDRKKNYPVYQFGKSLIFESSKCIDCRNCVDVCNKQGIDFLEIKEKGHLFEIIPSKDENKDCIYCGQCIVHCPAGAFEGVGEFEEINNFSHRFAGARKIEEIERPILVKDKIVVFQFAPSIRVSIGEEFDLPYGSVVTEKLVAGIRKLNIDKVFDVSVGADITTIEEAEELVQRITKNENLPLITSCCPSWVKFVEFYRPDIIPYLTSVRSPHIILGGVIKTFWAEKEGIDPQKIVVVSIMPCVAKKYEIEREEVRVNGLKPVDYVLTTRELARLFKKHKIDLKNICPEKPDNPLGLPSGAGVIYGASGGVMESALRTAFKKITNKELPKIEFKKARGMEGIKKASIKINNKEINLAVVNGMANAKKILEEMNNYHYIEVMSCFGGCIGGGGQPVPTDLNIREKRAGALYRVDKGKKLRTAHKNPLVNKIYKDFFNSKEKIHSICHTKYSAKKNKSIT